MMNLMLHSLQPSHGAVNFILAQLYVGVYTCFGCPGLWLDNSPILGTAFFVFSLVVLPTLLFMGLITFERVQQSGSADFIYAAASTAFATSIWSMPRRCSPT